MRHKIQTAEGVEFLPLVQGFHAVLAGLLERHRLRVSLVASELAGRQTIVQRRHLWAVKVTLHRDVLILEDEYMAGRVSLGKSRVQGMTQLQHTSHVAQRDICGLQEARARTAVSNETQHGNEWLSLAFDMIQLQARGERAREECVTAHDADRVRLFREFCSANTALCLNEEAMGRAVLEAKHARWMRNKRWVLRSLALQCAEENARVQQVKAPSTFIMSTAHFPLGPSDSTHALPTTQIPSHYPPLPLPLSPLVSNSHSRSPSHPPPNLLLLHLALSHSLRLRSTPSHSLPLPPTPSHSLPLPPTPSHSLPLPPTPSHSLPLPPTPSHSLPLPPTPSHSLPLPPTPSHSLPLPPTPSHSLPLPPTPSHSLPLPPTPSHSLPLPPTPSHSLPLPPTPSLPLPPTPSHSLPLPPTPSHPPCAQDLEDRARLIDLHKACAASAVLLLQRVEEDRRAKRLLDKWATHVRTMQDELQRLHVMACERRVRAVLTKHMAHEVRASLSRARLERAALGLMDVMPVETARREGLAAHEGAAFRHLQRAVIIGAEAVARRALVRAERRVYGRVGGGLQDWGHMVALDRASRLFHMWDPYDVLVLPFVVPRGVPPPRTLLEVRTGHRRRSSSSSNDHRTLNPDLSHAHTHTHTDHHSPRALRAAEAWATAGIGPLSAEGDGAALLPSARAAPVKKAGPTGAPHSLNLTANTGLPPVPSVTATRRPRSTPSADARPVPPRSPAAPAPRPQTSSSGCAAKALWQIEGRGTAAAEPAEWLERTLAVAADVESGVRSLMRLPLDTLPPRRSVCDSERLSSCGRTLSSAQRLAAGVVSPVPEERCAAAVAPGPLRTPLQRMAHFAAFHGWSATPTAEVLPRVDYHPSRGTPWSSLSLGL